MLSNSLKKNEYVLVVFKDLKKPYDTVNHENFLHKLKTYGIND